LAELAQKACAHDQNATRALVIAVGPSMLRAIRRVLGPAAGDSEDVLQDAVEGLVRALPTFRGACTVLHFACRVAVLSGLAWRRQWNFRARFSADMPQAAEDAPGTQPSPAEALSTSRQREALVALLDDLPPAQAEVVLLHCGLGFSVQEIADAAGCPIETVRSRLRLSKQSLRARIGASQTLAATLEVET
jgi:RNA polymerase sigma-70 factor (ECF subfamily)